MEIHEKRWTVEIFIDEHDGKTRARARLQTKDAKPITGVGLARCNPADRDVPEIGDELATARALSDLSHKLLDAAVDDIEAVTQKPATLPR
jgi:hypothetical protein